MALSPTSSSLELSISLPSFSQLSSHPSSGEHMVRDLDINQTPKTEAREWIMIGAAPHANEEESNSCGRRRKKLRLTKEQSHLLEESFTQNHTLASVSNELYCFMVLHTYVLLTLEKRRKERVNFLIIMSADYDLVK
ncbi:hypothetical protein Bca101_026937 [Brassica carinata]